MRVTLEVAPLVLLKPSEDAALVDNDHLLVRQFVSEPPSLVTPESLTHRYYES